MRVFQTDPGVDIVENGIDVDDSNRQRDGAQHFDTCKTHETEVAAGVQVPVRSEKLHELRPTAG